MSATAFQQDAGGNPWAEQYAGSELDYTLDWSTSLDDGDAIAESAWASDSGIVVDRKSHDDNSSTAWISGGIAGRWYTVTNTVTTTSGRRDSRSFRIQVKGTALGAGLVSVFPDLAAAVTEMRRDRLMGAAQTWMPGVALSDEYLLQSLRAAEAEVSRRLRVFLTPRTIVSQGTPAEEIAALKAIGEVIVEEPGYDFSSNLFSGNRWGRIDVRHRPIIEVRRISLVYPGTGAIRSDINLSWLTIDKQYGVIQMVPSGSAGMLPMSSLLLSALNGDSNIPFFVRIQYRAGLENVAQDWPDVLNLIKRMAVTNVLSDQFIPSSGSTSADGLSQSVSFQMTNYQGAIDKSIDSLSRAIHGIKLMVL